MSNIENIKDLMSYIRLQLPALWFRQFTDWSHAMKLLNHNEHIESITFENCEIYLSTAELIVEALETCHHLKNIAFYGNYSENAIIEFSKLSIRELNIPIHKLTDKFISEIVKNKHLIKLIVPFGNITDKGAEMVANMKSLTILDIQDNLLTDVGVMTLENSYSLKELYIGGEKCITKECVEIYKRNHFWNALELKKMF